MAEYPQKDFYKLNEVCQYTDTQPYVLRFWESEFPQLSPDTRGSGQRVYRKADIDLVKRIKQLLYEEQYTLAGARQKLEDEKSGRRRKGRAPKTEVESKATGEESAAEALRRAPAPSVAKFVPRAKQRPLPTTPIEPAEPETVERSRYEDAIDEIDHLRLQLKEADKRSRRADVELDQLQQQVTRQQELADRTIDRLERMVDALAQEPGG